MKAAWGDDQSRQSHEGHQYVWVRQIPKHKNGQGELFEAWKKRNLGQIEKKTTLVYTVSHKLLKQVIPKIGSGLKIIQVHRRVIYLWIVETQWFLESELYCTVTPLWRFVFGLLSCLRQKAKLCLLCRWPKMTKFMCVCGKHPIQSGALKLLNNGNNFLTT